MIAPSNYVPDSGTKPAAGKGPASGSRRTLPAVLFIALAFLSSLVLLVYPWLEWWDDNRFASWFSIWNSGYLRGGLSGLGAVTLAISVASMSRIGRR